MRFVKTAEEVAGIQSILARPQFMSTRSLRVLFETTPDAIRALLPPPLDPTPEAVGSAWVGEIGNSTCVGPFLGAALYVRARYGDIVGNYCVAMLASTDLAVTFGRELYGEPGKLARIVFESQDEHVWGSAERYDIRFMSLRGRLEASAPSGRQLFSTFHVKYLPGAGGAGFDHPPVLVHVEAEASISTSRRGKGELVLRESPHDPVADIPVTQVIDSVYTEGVTHTRGRVLCEVDPEQFLPYAFGKMDALDAIAEGTLMHAQAARKTREGRGRWRASAT